MKKHTRIYFKYHNIGETDFVPCECCGNEAKDIHHIKFRSRGGLDEISNLMAVCRNCHIFAHSGIECFNEKALQEIRNKNVRESDTKNNT
jgi:hypothetical protein